ncbi:unnamed protein product [Alopecurus aequalis]
MASIVSKLAQAAVASRACPAAVVVGGGRRPMVPRIYPIGWRRICSAVSPAENKVERHNPKSSSEAAAAAVTVHPVIISPGKNTSKNLSVPLSPLWRASSDPSMNLTVDARALESGETLWALYEYWNKRLGRQRSRAEMKRRFRRFRITAEWVHKANNSGGSIKYGLTKFADMRPCEMPWSRRRKLTDACRPLE